MSTGSVPGNIDANVKTIITAVRKKAADLTVFPELFLTGYIQRDAFARYAISTDNKIMKDIASVCKKTKCGVAFGFAEKGEKKGEVYNSCAFINEKGEILSYRKMYLPTFGPFEEGFFFKEGTGPVIAKCKGFSFGIMICYDTFFPEISKYYSMKGVDALLYVSSNPSVTRPFFMNVFPARALENTCYVLYSNNCTVQKGIIFPGGSAAYSPRGAKLAEAELDVDAHIDVTLEHEEIDTARRFRPVIRDTRHDMFALLASLNVKKGKGH